MKRADGIKWLREHGVDREIGPKEDVVFLMELIAVVERGAEDFEDERVHKK